MIDSKSLPAINAAVDKLMTKLINKQDELRRLEAISGKGWNPRRCNKVREEIASLEKRLALAERIQDEAYLSKGTSK